MPNQNFLKQIQERKNSGKNAGEAKSNPTPETPRPRIPYQRSEDENVESLLQGTDPEEDDEDGGIIQDSSPVTPYEEESDPISIGVQQFDPIPMVDVHAKVGLMEIEENETSSNPSILPDVSSDVVGIDGGGNCETVEPQPQSVQPDREENPQVSEHSVLSEPTTKSSDHIEETPKPKRGRGRPKMVIPEEQVDEPKPELKSEPKCEPVSEGTQEERVPDYTGMEIHDVVLDHVCRNLMLYLKENYRSKMYVDGFMKDLMQKYINGEIDASNPLFKSLIEECLHSNVEDPYLKGITKNVLEWIRDGE